MRPVTHQIDVVIPVYNGAPHILGALDSVFVQELPDGWDMQVFVVDDGSTDDTQARVHAAYPHARIVALSPNRGRSTACNQGAAAGRGGLLYFLDSDCRILKSNVLAKYVQLLSAGADAVFGPLHTELAGFWGRYQRAVYAGRHAQAKRGNMQVMTSCNFAMRRDVFENAQGFCSDYSRYGFEDRDFLQRLLKENCNLKFCDDAVVSHDNRDTLIALCQKMSCSAQHSAPIFMQKYAQAYAAMPYSKVDVRSRPVLRHVSWLSSLLPTLITLGERGANWFIPFRLKKRYVQAVLALAYLEGSEKPDEN